MGPSVASGESVELLKSQGGLQKARCMKAGPGRTAPGDAEGGKGSVKFRDTKRSYNIINHSKGPGVSPSASEHLRDQCPLGHDLTPLRCGVSNSLPTVRALACSFIPPTVCRPVLAYRDRKIRKTGFLPLGISVREGRAGVSSQLEQHEYMLQREE